MTIETVEGRHVGVNKRNVTVSTIPLLPTAASKIVMLCQIRTSALNHGSTHFVFDCTGMKSIGPAEVDLLLSCLEEVMKHNGDLRLAKLETGARIALYDVGISHVFETFSTIESAIASYQIRRTSLAPFYAADVYAAQNEFAA